MKQSKEIIQFYRELDQWVKDGCPEHDVFGDYMGLCFALERWCSSLEQVKALYVEMTAQFEEVGLDIHYPFGAEDYYERLDDDTMYECPKRLAWIESRLRLASDTDEQENKL